MEKSRNNNSRRLMAIIAVVLMVCLILAMGAVTFAKYITSGTTGDQTATAAKWGFVVSVDASKLFGEEYKGTGLATTTSDTGTVVVKASETGKNVLGPGTKGSMTFSINGSAEVLAQLKISIGAISGKTAVEEIHVGDYYPVKWTLTKNEANVEGAVSTTLATVIGKLNSTTTYTPGTSSNVDDSYTLSWEWALEQGEEDDAKATNNIKDTAIGYKADGKAYNDVKAYLDTSVIADATVYDNIETTMSFNLTISVEQIQTKTTD